MQFKEYYASPIGLIEITSDEEYLLSINVVSKATESNGNDITSKAKKQLKEYFNGIRKSFELPLKLDESEFSGKVLSALSTVEYGTLVSYKTLGEKAGYKKAYRAVGNTIHNNPYLIVVPCHRVVKSDGSIGGFALGLDIKRELLKIEGINI